MIRLIFVVSLSFFSTVLCAQVEVGDNAPKLEICDFVSWPKKAPKTLDGLKGRWVVVDFFAPWCPGCLASVEHLNQLAADSDDKQVVIIRLCASSKEIIESLNKRLPLKSWVAIDDDNKTSEAYAIGGHPQLVLINPAGKIVAFMRPASLSKKMLADLVRGRDFQLPSERFVATGKVGSRTWAKESKIESEDELAHAVIRYSSANEQTLLSFRSTPGKILADGVRLDQLLEHAYDVTEYQLDNQIATPERYRVSVVASTPSEKSARRMLGNLLEETFNYRPKWEDRETDVVVLKYDKSVESNGLRPGKPVGRGKGGFAGHAGMHVRGVKLEFVTRALGDYSFGCPVIDETGLEGLFDLDVDWDPADADSVPSALQRIGLVAKKTKRKLRFLVVSQSE